MDNDSINEQLSDMTSVDPSVQDNVNFDVTPSPSMTSTVTYEGHSPSLASIQTSAAIPSTRSDTEQHYQLVGNISVINQLYAIPT